MAVKNKYQELKDKKKRHGDMVKKLKKEGKVTSQDSVLARINDLTELVLNIAEEIKEKING